jgi:D-alanyl-D-alanine carboxypeptidase/D-alanyl-D-alanine-endopeptidase (penicillin-binding protein 4)
VRTFRLHADYYQLLKKTNPYKMIRKLLLVPALMVSLAVSAQKGAIEQFLSDTSMAHASVSVCFIDAKTGEVVTDYNCERSLSQASVMKLITTAAALEKLGPEYTFKTIVGYSGKIKKGSKTLDGNIIIKGGGDPALGSEKFPDYYDHLLDKWVEEVTRLGIKRITGRVITDDSNYDYEPVPSNWNWGDMGNYYGAGVYGLSVFDNTLKIHFKTGDEGSLPLLLKIEPSDNDMVFENFLKASGSTDQGYVYSSPYYNKGWISGTIPVNREDFILKASITDPPLFTARLLTDKLKSGGINIKLPASTTRLMPGERTVSITEITTASSPALSAIVEVLNHESVNLYAEHLLKEMGKVFKGEGTTSAGTSVVKEFLDSIGIDSRGMFIEDGSGLSPQDAVNSKGLAMLLFHMKKESKAFDQYYNSLPEAGKNGTLKNVFKDSVFDSRLKAKSGSLTRVRSYAGYFTTMSGKEMIFSIIVNNYSGPSRTVISGIEAIIKEFILTR